MNLIEVKALFFSHYYMQEVFIEPMMGKKPNYFNGANIDDHGEDNYLLLRSTDQLTDEEALDIAEIFDLDEKQIADTDLIEWIQALFTESAGYYIDGYTGEQLLFAIDYLRAIGIILPILFLNEEKKPVKLSVEEILLLGWAKTNEK